MTRNLSCNSAVWRCGIRMEGSRTFRTIEGSPKKDRPILAFIKWPSTFDRNDWRLAMDIAFKRPKCAPLRSPSLRAPISSLISKIIADVSFLICGILKLKLSRTSVDFISVALDGRARTDRMRNFRGGKQSPRFKNMGGRVLGKYVNMHNSKFSPRKRATTTQSTCRPYSSKQWPYLLILYSNNIWIVLLYCTRFGFLCVLAIDFKLFVCIFDAHFWIRLFVFHVNYCGKLFWFLVGLNPQMALFLCLRGSSHRVVPKKF